MPVYFDNNATTRLDPRVLEAMLPYLSGPYGNASSLHRFGRAARDAVERAREQLAVLVNCQPREIIWTSGGTESNNLALKGVTDAAAPSRLLYGATEHPAVLEAAESLRDRGWKIETVAVDQAGVIDWPRFERQLETGAVRLVSLMRANNETGVIQDIERAAQRVHGADAWLHVDAVQACGKIAVDFAALQADLMSVSSHKIYGPKGMGALIVRAEVEVHPLHHGGVQERGLRGGTENVAAIVGFGAAAELAQQELDARAAHVRALRDRLETGLRALPEAHIFGFAVSSGSACASGTGEPSHVLLGMGIAREIAEGAIRVSFGKDNTEAEVDQFLNALAGLTRPLAMSPR